MTNSIFMSIYSLELVLISGVRSTATAKFRRESTKVDYSTPLDSGLLSLNAVGMLLPLVYIFSPWLDFADYSLPDWLRRIGVGMFLLASPLFYKTHRDLGSSWTPTPGLRENHRLVTEGIFRYIRHSMYTAHLIWALAQPLILANWIVGFSLLIPQLLHYLVRIKPEEEMMLEHFGEDYQAYIKSTGRFLPRLKGG